MLSYRHGYHAGNHGDVLKHVVWLAILRHLLRKPAPFSVIDTHAGPGSYDFESAQASKNAEHREGFDRLAYASSPPPPLVEDYLAAVRTHRKQHGPSTYPGSVSLTLANKRAQDRAVCFELHPTDHETLGATIARHRHVARFRQDGFQGLLAHLPPKERRGAVLIDPSYELKSDYENAVECVQAAHRRFATGVYALWYPVVSRHRIDTLLSRLTTSGIRKIVRLELCIGPDTSTHGMTGSGMVVINPPYTLLDQANDAVPWLCHYLGTGGRTVCEWLVQE